MAKGGSGQFKLGYIFLDEEGSQAVNQATFNQYDGFAVSVERFRYMFDSGIRIKADLKNISLNNRNLNLGLERSGLFGIRLHNDQYRRAYDFDGASFTRRHRTGASLWLIPHRFIKFFGGGEYIGKTGKMEALFDLGNTSPPIDVDYDQVCYNAGFRINYLGRMFQAEYRAGNFDDNKHRDRDRSRYRIRLIGMGTVPRYEWIMLSGGFQHFETKFDESEFKISSNSVWGTAAIELPENFALKYHGRFDRTSSDSDVVATDNLAHAFYLSRSWPGLARLTAGYQHDINDDFEDAVSANSAYFSGWLKPVPQLEFRGEFGLRAETVDEGSRLLGDEDRTRFRLSAIYSSPAAGSINLKFENKRRKNDQLGSEANFSRISIDRTMTVVKYVGFSGGYAFATGDYKNNEQEFKFDSHVLYADLTSKEYRNLTAGFGAVYCRSKRDLDVESFTLRFSAMYQFMREYAVEAFYNIHNFDDYLIIDRYYTANIVEINIKKSISF
jgi:hypothetical protein